MMDLMILAIAEGLLYGTMALGVFLTYRILDFPDLTSEGAFPLGAAVCARLLLSGIPAPAATFLSLLAGMGVGLMTGLLVTKGRLPGLLAGILTMTGLYSINLRIMGRSNTSLLEAEKLQNLFGMNRFPEVYRVIGMGIAVSSVLILFLVWFFQTEAGQSVIATGDNEKMARSLGISTDRMKILGLMLSNGVIAASGALIAQNNGYADIGMGIGTIVIGLASVIIGEVLFKNLTLPGRLVSILLGAISYRLILMFVISAGLNPNDLRLVSAILLAFFLMLPDLQIHLKKQTYLERRRSE